MKNVLEISIALPNPFWEAVVEAEVGLAQCILLEVLTACADRGADHPKNDSFLTTHLPWCELDGAEWDAEHVSGCLILVCFDPLKPNRLIVPFYLDFIGQTIQLDLPAT